MAKYLCLLLLVLCATIGHAATYYVDYGAADDTGSGTQVSPWKYAPGDARGAHTIANGDTVIFKGGVTYTANTVYVLITINNSSTTWRGNTVAEDWGTGKAVIDLNESAYRAFDAIYQDGVIIQNFEIKKAKSVYSSAGLTGTCPAGQAKTTRDGYDACRTYSGEYYQGIIRNYCGTSGGSNWSLKDLIIHSTQYNKDLCVVNAEGDGDGSTPADIPSEQTGIYIVGQANNNHCSNITIDNVEMYSVGKTGIELTYCHDVTVKNSNFGGLNRGTDTGYFSVAFRVYGANTNLTFQDNIIHDAWQYDGDGAQPRCHAGDWAHFMEEGGQQTAVIIERNLYYNNHAFTSGMHHQQAMIAYINYADGVDIRNNVSINPAGGAHMNFYGATGATTNLRIYNNTFVSYSTNNYASAPIEYIEHDAGDANSLTIKNNIWYVDSSDNNWMFLYLTGSGIPIMDYNRVYRGGSSTAKYAYISGTSTYYTLSEWQTYLGGCPGAGNDCNSAVGDPSFMSHPATGATSSSGDYSLTANISGENLSGSFTTDYAGRTRSNWTVGAHEYIGDLKHAPWRIP